IPFTSVRATLGSSSITNMRISPPPARWKNCRHFNLRDVQSPSAVYPKTFYTSLELLTRILVLPDTGSFHLCRFLCCTSIEHFIVRTAKPPVHFPATTRCSISAGTH